MKLSFIAALMFVVALPGTAFAQLSGSVTYTGTESGRIFVEAFREEDPAFLKNSTSMINPGAFEFTNLEDGDYNVVSFIDSDGNGILDGGEPWVAVSDVIEVPPGDSGISLNLDNYRAPSEPGAEEDDGCCAVISGEPRSHHVLSMVLLLGVVLLRRRSRPN